MPVLPFGVSLEAVPDAWTLCFHVSRVVPRTNTDEGAVLAECLHSCEMCGVGVVMVRFRAPRSYLQLLETMDVEVVGEVSEDILTAWRRTGAFQDLALEARALWKNRWEHRDMCLALSMENTRRLRYILGLGGVGRRRERQTLCTGASWCLGSQIDGPKHLLGS